MTGRDVWMRECVEGGNVDEEVWGWEGEMRVGEKSVGGGRGWGEEEGVREWGGEDGGEGWGGEEWGAGGGGDGRGGKGNGREKGDV